MKLVTISVLFFVYLIVPAKSGDLIFLCKHQGGQAGPKVVVDIERNKVLFGELEQKITGNTAGYITFIQEEGIGGTISIMNLSTGIINNVGAGIISNGEYHSHTHEMKCRKNSD